MLIVPTMVFNEKTFITRKGFEQCNENYIGCQKTVYETETKLVTTALKLFGALPIYKNNSGTMEFSIRSWIMLYSFSLFIALIITATVVIWDIIMYFFAESTIKFSEKVQAFGWIYSGVLAFIPIISFFEASGYINYLNSWKMFQVAYCDVTNSLLSVSAHRTNMVIIILIIFWQIIVQSLYFIALSYENLRVLMTNLVGVYYFCMQQFWVWFWYLSCYTLYSAAENIHLSFLKNSKCPLSIHTLIKYRSLWMQLSALVRQLGAEFSYTYSFLILFMFIDLTLNTYCLLLVFRVGMEYQNMFSIVCVANSGVLLYILCNSAELVTKKINHIVEMHTNIVDTTATDNAIELEIQGMLQRFQSFPPNITLGGFITVNRRLLVSLAAMLVTYMIVIIQFDADEKTNKSESLCCNNDTLKVS